MQDIHVSRLKDHPYVEGVIEPEDRSWRLQLTKEGPVLLIRTQYEVKAGGPREHGYIDVREVPDLTLAELAQSVFGDPCGPEISGLKCHGDGGVQVIPG